MSEPDVTLEEALARLDAAVPMLLTADPTVRAVGLEDLPGGGYGLVTTQCRDVIRPLGATTALPTKAEGLPVRHRTVARSPAVLARMPLPLNGGAASQPVAERNLHRPLPWGAELQNFDADRRGGYLARGGVCVGSLGCVVRTREGRLALLSNNHVLADENHGLPGHDRVLQCAARHYAPSHDVARLGAFEPVISWQGPGTVPPLRAMNLVDAALAELNAGIDWLPTWLNHHGMPPAHGLAVAMQGDRVHKVGRTTGGTQGVVTQIGITMGPVGYMDGPAYFRRVFAIERDDGRPFASNGDSGAAIVRSDGALVGLLFAGDDVTTYACDAHNVMAALGCTLA